MKKELKSSERGARAFSRTELLVVVLTLAVVSAGLLLALRWNKEPGRRVQCAANLRQLGAALSLYAGDWGGLLPDCTRANPGFFGSKWLWDLVLRESSGEKTLARIRVRGVRGPRGQGGA